MINLITSFYLLENSNQQKINRNNELIETLKKNLESNVISKIHLFIDNEDLIDFVKSFDSSNKINIINFGKQPLYSDFFRYANENLQDNLCLISNSDIYIHECDLDCLNKLENNIFSLTRYEFDLSCPLIDNYQGSHDVFIFKSPINVNYEKVSHVQNVWGSENSVIDMISENGYTVLNPCYQIKIVHLHSSQYRNDDRIRIPGGKFLPRPTYL